MTTSTIQTKSPVSQKAIGTERLKKIHDEIKKELFLFSGVVNVSL